MSDVIYTLQEGFEYSYKGETAVAGFITLFAPTYKQMGHYAPIKQAFVQAITEQKSDVDQDDLPDVDESASKEELSAEHALMLLYASTADMSKLFLHATELYKSGAALVDGESKLTIPLMEAMNFEDVQNLLGTYIGAFIMPSLQTGAKKPT